MRTLFVITLSLLLTLASGAASESASQSHKVIDFDGELIEGINKQPLDSLNHVSQEQQRAKRKHLYRKRKSFHSENQLLVERLGGAP
ncbi:hypothetical protein WDW86_02500 [Bdellovibrionota bacterium FG-2]